VELHPKAIVHYRERIATLRDALARDDDADYLMAKEILRGLVERIEIHPLPVRGRVDIRIAERLNLASRRTGTDPERAIRMVAEEGIEPPTRGL
jgi:hypothetical protein